MCACTSRWRKSFSFNSLPCESSNFEALSIPALKSVTSKSNYKYYKIAYTRTLQLQDNIQTHVTSKRSYRHYYFVRRTKTKINSETANVENNPKFSFVKQRLDVTKHILSLLILDRFSEIIPSIVCQEMSTSNIWYYLYIIKKYGENVLLHGN